MMTREEAIEIFEQKGWWIAQKETFTSKQAEEIIKLNDAVNFALSALRPVSREQVEKVWRGCRSCKGCRSCVYSIHDLKDMPCKKCDPNAEGIVTEYKPSNFCPVCGKPLTDEAVEMVMERLGALHEVAE